MKFKNIYTPEVTSSPDATGLLIGSLGAGPVPVAARTQAEVCRFFAGLELVEPGVV